MVQLLFGAPETHHCDICQQERTFRQVVTYKVHHLWWIFRWVTDKSYGVICQICRNGHRVEARAAEASVSKNPIPWFDRLGWAGGLGGLAVLGSLGAVAAQAEDALYINQIEHPQVGDIYEVDLMKLGAKPNAEDTTANGMYAPLMVTRVTAAGVEVRVPVQYATTASLLHEKITDGTAKAPAFYGPDIAHYTVGELKKMRADRALLSVDR